MCSLHRRVGGRADSRVRFGQRQAIVATLAAKYDAALVEFRKVFDAATTPQTPADSWVWDRVHPTYRGHQPMADEWERVVRGFWK